MNLEIGSRWSVNVYGGFAVWELVSIEPEHDPSYNIKMRCVGHPDVKGGHKVGDEMYVEAAWFEVRGKMPRKADGSVRASPNETGKRVKVAIREPSRYSGPDRFQGRMGVVRERKENSINGEPAPGPALLVEFDEPIPSGWSGSPITAFWFPPCDVEVQS